MKNQRLRNLTTGKLHTTMDDIYKDIEFITGESGIMTHDLGMACGAMKPFLQRKLVDSNFWNDFYDVTHVGETQIEPMNNQERDEFWVLFGKQPNPLFS